MTAPRTMTPTAAFHFDNSYARELPGFYVACQPAPAPEPRLLFLNHALAYELGLDAEALHGAARAALLPGNAPPEAGQPIPTAHSGDQFRGVRHAVHGGGARQVGER